jgi:hypothetical protein
MASHVGGQAPPLGASLWRRNRGGIDNANNDGHGMAVGPPFPPPRRPGAARRTKTPLRELLSRPGTAVRRVVQSGLEIRSFVTQEHGACYFMDLSPDREYKLQARYQRLWGPVKTLSRFNSRKEATIDLKVDVRKEE